MNPFLFNTPYQCFTGNLTQYNFVQASGFLVAIQTAFQSLVPMLPTMQHSHWVTSLEAVYQITCSNLWKRLYATFFFLFLQLQSYLSTSVRCLWISPGWSCKNFQGTFSKDDAWWGNDVHWRRLQLLIVISTETKRQFMQKSARKERCSILRLHKELYKYELQWREQKRDTVACIYRVK